MSDILGEAIYEKDDFSIHEVDGEEHKVSGNDIHPRSHATNSIP
jgi:hypothetical protein